MRPRTFAYGIVIIAYIVLEGMLLTGNMSRLMSSLLVPVCCYIVAAIGLNMNVGYSGELNLGQAGFMGIGVFTAAILSGALSTVIPNGIIRLILAIIVSAVVAGVAGWLISIPVLKLQGDYLAIVTLAFGQILMSLLTNLYVGVDAKGLHFAFITNTIQLEEGGKMLVSGPMGAIGVTTVSTFTMGVILVLVSLAICFNLIYSKEGRAIQAARDNRIAIETVGIEVARTKTIAFVLSAALAGAAGALYALNFKSFVASKFSFNTSILILVYVVLGGLGNMGGTIIATSLLVILPEVLRFLSSYRMLIYAIVLIAIMLLTNNEKFKLAVETLKKKFTKKKEAA